MNVALNITSIPAQEAFLVDAPTPTSPNPRWIQTKWSSPHTGSILCCCSLRPAEVARLKGLVWLEEDLETMSDWIVR